MTKYNQIWPYIQTSYQKAKFFYFIFLSFIILIAAFFLIPIFQQLVTSSRGWFVLMVIIGSIILFVDGIWLILYRQNLALLDKTNKTLPMNCPFCGREFHIEKIDRKLLFDIPAAQFKVSCSFCGTELALGYPYEDWVFTKVDPILNSTFAWLYQGERLSREDLNLVLNREHTEKAKVKLRASGNSDLVHIWFDRPTARTITKLRTGPLEKIVSGDISALSELNSNILYNVYDVNTHFFKDPGDLSLRKKESVILTVSPVRLAAHKTNQNGDRYYTKDTGFFFVTNQRVGFRGNTFSTNFTIDMIDDLDHQSDKIVIRSHHRKTPDYYLDLDGELIYCVIKGLLKTNGVS